MSADPSGVSARVKSAPIVIGPANFPLFLPGVQAIQALVAGNAVTWKPGAGGERVAILLAHVLREAGLVTTRRIGQWVFYQRDEAAIQAFLQRLAREL